MNRPWGGLGWVILALFLPAMLHAEPLNDEVLKRVLDRAFCSPDTVFPQPLAWQKQSIQYDRWAKGGDMAITLDQQIHQLLFPLIQQYAQENHLDIRLREGTCGTSAGLVSRKMVDSGGFCCPPGKSDRLPGLTFHTLGIVSIAILLHPENPITDLSLKQVREIFQGNPRHWSQITDTTGTQGLPL
ncbi:MAG: hypothetical protein HQL94_11270, partial [Magnetococcales bacterium]|nr:hypothetical protein [Magnetococcales bacterium]